jgi:hypothetical protein
MSDEAASTQAAGLESLPRTAQGWIPITLFDKAYFHEGQDFIVQLSERIDGVAGIICSAQWMIDEQGGPLKFVGDWRYVDEFRHLEPVAFQPMPKPSAFSEIYALHWRAGIHQTARVGIDIAAPGADTTALLLSWERDVATGIDERRIA